MITGSSDIFDIIDFYRDITFTTVSPIALFVETYVSSDVLNSSGLKIDALVNKAANGFIYASEHKVIMIDYTGGRTGYDVKASIKLKLIKPLNLTKVNEAITHFDRELYGDYRAGNTFISVTGVHVSGTFEPGVRLKEQISFIADYGEKEDVARDVCLQRLRSNRIISGAGIGDFFSERGTDRYVFEDSYLIFEPFKYSDSGISGV